MPVPPFAPGFRISALDVGVLIAGAAGALAVARIHVSVGIAIAFVVGHFFLFCNILRMPRRLELTWAFVFAGLAMAASTGLVWWSVVFGAAASLTVILTIVATRRPSYHGAGWRKINPGLPQWWEVNGQK